jgi:hypothetical protein
MTWNIYEQGKEEGWGGVGFAQIGTVVLEKTKNELKVLEWSFFA